MINVLKEKKISNIIYEYVTPGICKTTLTYIVKMFYSTIGHLSQENIDLIKERYKNLAVGWSEEEIKQDQQECDEFLQNANVIKGKIKESDNQINDGINDNLVIYL